MDRSSGFRSRSRQSPFRARQFSGLAGSAWRFSGFRPAARARPCSARHAASRVIVGRRRQAIAANHQLFLQLRLVGPVCSLLLGPRFLRLRWLHRNVTDRSDDNFVLRARNFPWPILSSLSGGPRRGWVQTVPGGWRSRQRWNGMTPDQRKSRSRASSTRCSPDKTALTNGGCGEV